MTKTVLTPVCSAVTSVGGAPPAHSQYSQEVLIRNRDYLCVCINWLVLKDGSRHFGLGGLHKWQIQKDTKIRTPLGGCGGMPPRKFLTYSCSETASGAI